MNSTSHSLLEMTPVLPVVQIADADQAIPVAQALRQGGIAVLEVVLRTPASLEAIRRIRAEVPDVVVGAGTVTDMAKLEAAVEAGSEFLITPGLTPTMAKACQDLSMPVVPGVSCASDIMLGLEYGFSAFKFFPAEASGGIAALKALAGPFGDIRFCPTGGISPDNLAAYLALDCVTCVGGSWLTPKALLKRKAWAEVTQLTQQAVAAARLNEEALDRAG
jgi:2-dehydro-3-deoxyphosphogluconate aldolase/(4S)-4-hydroxy-2-oxoglutarate aldolase